MRTTIEGLDKLQRRFDTMDFVAPGAEQFLRDWSEGVKEEAQRNVPVFHGDTRDSIDAEVKGGQFPTEASVSVGEAGRWREYGTGELSEDPKSPRRPYFPPPERLRDWAQSKGRDPYEVAYGIWRSGGTPPTHFFSDAAETVERKMPGMLQRFGGKIEFDASH